jgi:hypothetical protein
VLVFTLFAQLRRPMALSDPLSEQAGELRFRTQIGNNETQESVEIEESAQDKVRRLNQEAQNGGSDKPKRTYGRTPDGRSRLAIDF